MQMNRGGTPLGFWTAFVVANKLPSKSHICARQAPTTRLLLPVPRFANPQAIQIRTTTDAKLRVDFDSRPKFQQSSMFATQEVRSVSFGKEALYAG